jgi:catechol 2,3-dioxygenase-like lactoylglutathione lyase family enzyme
MEKLKAIFKNAWPYVEGRKMNLPVENLEAAIPFYENIMGFQVISRKDSPYKSVVLGRDAIQIGLAENGGDPSQEGCFFEVDNVEAVLIEFKSNGLKKESSDLKTEQNGAVLWKVFYVIAPDGLCYRMGERLN